MVLETGLVQLFKLEQKHFHSSFRGSAASSEAASHLQGLQAFGRPHFAWTLRGNVPCFIPVINLRDRGHVVFETSHFIVKGICKVTLPEVGSAPYANP